ncbi:MAG: DUF4083 domain-containing protein [Bacillaceae bacterium]|nr:DUF4083 domain-containing protein [Bacillaceae bacterium]
MTNLIDVLFQLLFFGSFIIAVALIIWLFRSISNLQKQLHRIERRLDEVTEPCQRDHELGEQ